GFGNFRARHRSPRVGRNPKTGERVSIAANHVPFFKAGKDLRERVASALVSDVEEKC
ncbi:MAG: HU family DNA-binding protein, partial [Candidatus Tectomicrobia bacterium]